MLVKSCYTLHDNSKDKDTQHDIHALLPAISPLCAQAVIAFWSTLARDFNNIDAQVQTCFCLQADIAFWSSLVQYLNNKGDGADGNHNAINSFFMWAWDGNADTQFGLGGMIQMDYETLNWPKMAMLIDNSTEFSYGLGLRPWYLPGFILPSGNHHYVSRDYGLGFE